MTGLATVCVLRLPVTLRFRPDWRYIDETSEVCEATIIWRRGSTVGIRLQGVLPEDAMTASRRFALRERYYAIPG